MSGKVFIVAEMSANHNMDFDRAKAIIKVTDQDIFDQNVYL